MKRACCSLPLASISPRPPVVLFLEDSPPGEFCTSLRYTYDEPPDAQQGALLPDEPSRRDNITDETLEIWPESLVQGDVFRQ